MNFVIVATPGTADGPCRGSCDHRKCHLLREIAHGRCHHCGVILGFGSKITGEPAMHLRCAQAIATHDPIVEPINHTHHSAAHHSVTH